MSTMGGTQGTTEVDGDTRARANARALASTRERAIGGSIMATRTTPRTTTRRPRRAAPPPEAIVDSEGFEEEAEPEPFSPSNPRVKVNAWWCPYGDRAMQRTRAEDNSIVSEPCDVCGARLIDLGDERYRVVGGHAH